MTKDDIIKLAREAGIEIAADSNVRGFFDCMERFAALVAAAEREECAKVCEQWDATHPQRLAEAIRARGTA